MAAYYSLYSYNEGIKKDTAKLIFDSIRNPLLCGRLIVDKLVVACGIAVIERGYVGLMNVVVRKEYRGNGYGRQICEALMYEAKQAGAHTAYLQLLQNNTVALGLAKDLGFDEVYKYWYRVKNVC